MAGENGPFEISGQASLLSLQVLQFECMQVYAGMLTKELYSMCFGGQLRSKLGNFGF